MAEATHSLKKRSPFGSKVNTDGKSQSAKEEKQMAVYAKLQLARINFFEYCNLLAPDFYKRDRKYLVKLCNEMQDFYYSDDDVLIINLPPRHGKSRTAGMFAGWLFGQSIQEQIMTGSYNETLSTVFSKNVRNTIMEEKTSSDILVYRDIFPQVAIKHGDGAMNLWSLCGAHNNYLATSPSGTATGFGASLMIIDDLIKNAKEASNDGLLQESWEWYTKTMLSRLEEGGKVIIIMTRWSTKDLAGRALEHYKDTPEKVRHITMKALQNDGTMLCEEVLSKATYLERIRAMGVDIARANYQQAPIDIQGKLYKDFKTYEAIPKDKYGNSLLEGIYSYTDTADEGSDYLCSIIYGVYNKEAYILDIYYTKDPMEVTEKETARRMYNYNVNEAFIESNNGGKGFARQVQSELWNNYNSNQTVIDWFHQSQNKRARILSNASWVMEHIYYPVNYKDKWSEYYRDMNSYQKEGKNEHDDAPDATTGVAEMVNNTIASSRRNYSGKGARY